MRRFRSRFLESEAKSYRNLDRNWGRKSFPFGFLGLGIRVLGKWEEEHWVWAWEWIDCGGRGAPEKETVEEREKRVIL